MIKRFAKIALKTPVIPHVYKGKLQENEVDSESFSEPFETVNAIQM